MYAIIDFNSRQYKVIKDQEINLDRVDAEKDGMIVVDKVLLFSDKDRILIGTPYLPNSKVILKVLNHIKGDKIRVSRFKAKSRYQRVKGFRPYLSNTKVISIDIGK